MPFTTRPWNGAASRWPDPASYCRACLVDNNASGAEKTKSECHFPVKEPDGTYNVNALRAVVGGRGAQANFPGAEAARARARSLLAEYNNAQRGEAHMDITYRSAELVYRAGEDGEPDVLEGRMAPYGEWTEIRSAIEGNFMEQIAPSALKKTAAEKVGKLKVLFEHGFSRSLDRAALGLVQQVDDKEDGAYYRAELLPSIPTIIMDGIRRGLYGTSVALRNVKTDVDRSPPKSDYNPRGLPEHTIKEASLKEISVVTFPAYEGATAGLARSVIDDLYSIHLVPFLASERPEFLLELARHSAEVEPPHSEPGDQEPEKAEPDVVEASRSTPPKPRKDWLSDKEATPQWRIP